MAINNSVSNDFLSMLVDSINFFDCLLSSVKRLKPFSGDSTDLISSAVIGLIHTNFQRKIANIILPIIFSICFGGSKEPSH